MGDEGANGSGALVIGFIIMGIIVYFVVKELTRKKTRVVEITRDESGRVVQITETEMWVDERE